MERFLKPELSRPPDFALFWEKTWKSLMSVEPELHCGRLVQQLSLLNADQVFKRLRTMTDLHKHPKIDRGFEIPPSAIRISNRLLPKGFLPARRAPRRHAFGTRAVLMPLRAQASSKACGNCASGSSSVTISLTFTRPPSR
jgi:hypothetical protein